MNVLLCTKSPVVSTYYAFLELLLFARHHPYQQWPNVPSRRRELHYVLAWCSNIFAKLSACPHFFNFSFPTSSLFRPVVSPVQLHVLFLIIGRISRTVACSHVIVTRFLSLHATLNIFLSLSLTVHLQTFSYFIYFFFVRWLVSKTCVRASISQWFAHFSS